MMTKTSFLFMLVGSLALLSNGPGAGQQVEAPAESFFQQDVAWSPDGGRLAFSQLPTDGEYEAARWSVFTLDLDGGEPMLVAEGARNVGWSPDGKRLAFGALRDGNWEIVTSDPEGEELRRLTRNEATDGAPAWSPDGESIAFHSNRSGSFKIYAVDQDGSNLRQITNGDGDDYNPSWSPDGSTIVFYRSFGDGADQIWTVSGETETQLTSDERNNIFPAYGPGEWITFASKPAEGVSILAQVKPDGSGRVEHPEIETFFARYSPDGDRVAFIEGRWPRSAVYLATAEGRLVRKIVN